MGVYIPALAQSDPRKIVATLHTLAQGGTNSKGTFTLAANATTTTVSIATASTTSVISWQPVTADAAAQMATLFCTGGSTAGTLVLTHASNTSTDQTFNFVVHL